MKQAAPSKLAWLVLTKRSSCFYRSGKPGFKGGCLKSADARGKAYLTVARIRIGPQYSLDDALLSCDGGELKGGGDGGELKGEGGG